MLDLTNIDTYSFDLQTPQRGAKQLLGSHNEIFSNKMLFNQFLLKTFRHFLSPSFSAWIFLVNSLFALYLCFKIDFEMYNMRQIMSESFSYHYFCICRSTSESFRGQHAQLERLLVQARNPSIPWSPPRAWWKKPFSQILKKRSKVFISL